MSNKNEKQKRPSILHPFARAEYDGSMKSYREIQARILPVDEAESFDSELPPSWRSQPAAYLLRTLGLKRGLPPGTGFGLVQSPFADVYTV